MGDENDDHGFSDAPDWRQDIGGEFGQPDADPSGEACGLVGQPAGTSDENAGRLVRDVQQHGHGRS